MTGTDWIQAISTVILVIITGLYAWRTHVISKATKQQAEASLKMAKEMKEQRLLNLRPLVIQKAICKEDGSFSHFEISNVGNGPAIDIQGIHEWVEKGEVLLSVNARQTYLSKDDPPIRLFPHAVLISDKDSTQRIVCQYQSIFSHGSQQTWYQTYLPFEAKEFNEGKIFLTLGALEFKELGDKERYSVS